MKQQRILIPGALGLAVLAALSTSRADAPPPSASSLSAADIPDTQNAQPWVRPSYLQALRAPLPASIYPTTTAPPVIRQFERFPNMLGMSGNYLPGGPVKTAENAFFQPFGSNQRSCFTCHQTSDGMSITPQHAQAVFAATRGKDPLFAPVDGANCPNQVPAAATSGALLGGRVGSGKHTDLRAAYSQLLNKGLFRIFLPVPKQTSGPDPHPTEFTIELVSDPNGCNTDPAYNQEVDPVTGEVTQIISVYRRPLITTNFKFKMSALPNLDPTIPAINLDTREPLPIDPLTGLFENLNKMWDGRDLTLQDQAANAVRIHAQSTVPPTDAQVAQMLAFQNGIFSAQEVLKTVNLSSGANGGSQYLSTRSPKSHLNPPTPPFDEFDAWSTLSPTTPKEELQASIGRGQTLFNTFEFPFRIGNIVGRGCATCHGENGSGSEIATPGQRNTGVGGHSVATNGPSPDPTLPIFKLTCTPEARPSPDGAVVITNDPGVALITGKCEDIGRFAVPTIRSLPARAPYFHDGSAATVLDIVNFYDRRFTIGLTDQQKQDMVNFLNAL